LEPWPSKNGGAAWNNQGTKEVVLVSLKEIGGGGGFGTILSSKKRGGPPRQQRGGGKFLVALWEKRRGGHWQSLSTERGERCQLAQIKTRGGLQNPFFPIHKESRGPTPAWGVGFHEDWKRKGKRNCSGSMGGREKRQSLTLNHIEGKRGGEGSQDSE